MLMVERFFCSGVLLDFFHSSFACVECSHVCSGGLLGLRLVSIHGSLARCGERTYLRCQDALFSTSVDMQFLFAANLNQVHPPVASRVPGTDDATEVIVNLL